MKKTTVGIIGGGIAALVGAFVGGLFTGKAVQRHEDNKACDERSTEEAKQLT